MWEHLNSRDLRDPQVVSSLSTSNTEYYDQLREKQKRDADNGHGSDGGTARENLQQQQLKDMRLAMEAAQKSRARKDTEEHIILNAYLPAATVSALLRCVCASFETEQNLAVYMEALFKAAFNKNLRDLDIAPVVNSTDSVSVGSGDRVVPTRPKKIDYVQVRHIFDFVEEPDIKRVLQVEHRTTTKIMGPYMHRNKARDSL